MIVLYNLCVQSRTGLWMQLRGQLGNNRHQSKTACFGVLFWCQIQSERWSCSRPLEPKIPVLFPSVSKQIWFPTCRKRSEPPTPRYTFWHGCPPNPIICFQWWTTKNHLSCGWKTHQDPYHHSVWVQKRRTKIPAKNDLALKQKNNSDDGTDWKRQKGLTKHSEEQ